MAMKQITIVLAMLMLAGCYNKPEINAPATNGDFEVQKLFTIDGCTVYRFNDSVPRYFTKCVDARSETTWWEGCGKNCSRDMTVPSV